MSSRWDRFHVTEMPKCCVDFYFWRFRPFQELSKSRSLALQAAGNSWRLSTSTIFLYLVRSRCLHCALFHTMACRQTLHTLFSRPKSSLSCDTRRLHVEIYLGYRLEAFLRRSTTLGFHPTNLLCSYHEPFSRALNKSNINNFLFDSPLNIMVVWNIQNKYDNCDKDKLLTSSEYKIMYE